MFKLLNLAKIITFGKSIDASEGKFVSLSKVSSNLVVKLSLCLGSNTLNLALLPVKPKNLLFTVGRRVLIKFVKLKLVIMYMSIKIKNEIN